MKTQHFHDLSVGVRLVYAASMGLLCLTVSYAMHLVEPSLTPTALPFNWEQTIPFLQWMAIPYMSLYLLFFLAFLLCRDKQEISSLCKQAVFVLGISTLCFLLLPAKFSFDTPKLTGLMGNLVSFFQLDNPYCQFPSLHTAFSLIIWQVVNSHIKQRYKPLVFFWFCLLIASNVFFYQHHLLDVVGGLFTAALALYFYSPHACGENNKTHYTIQHFIVGFTYMLPAFSLILLGSLMKSWFLVLIYPGISLALISLAYLRNNSNFTQKRDGRFPWWSWVLFLPYLLTIRALWKFRCDSCRPWTRINSGIVIGRNLSSQEWPSANDLGITTILDLSPEISDTNTQGLEYIYMPLLSNVPPSNAQLEKICRQISESYLEGTIFIHCNLGNDRVVTVLTAYLVAQNHDLVQSMEIVQKFKPNFDLPGYYLKSLLQFTIPMKENHLLEQDASSSRQVVT